MKLQDLKDRVVRVKETTPSYILFEDITSGEGSWLNTLYNVSVDGDDVELMYEVLKPEQIKP